MGTIRLFFFYPFKIQILYDLAEPNGDRTIASEGVDIHNNPKHSFLCQFL